MQVKANSKVFAKQKLQSVSEIPVQITKLYLFTINHKTTPVPVREKLTFSEHFIGEAYIKLKQFHTFSSVLLLSTCNRTEIYFTSDDLTQSLTDICVFLSSYFNIEEKVVKEYKSVFKGSEVVNHAFHLACGLDSLVVGEKQILTQLTKAYSLAQKEKTLDLTLELLLQNAIKSAREIHKKTNLSKDSPSISSVAVELADKICNPIKTKSVLVLGAGTMAKLALEHILKLGGTKETIALNKSPHRIIEFSEKYKITKSFPFEDIYTVINDADILICAAGAPHFILFAEQFKKLRKDTGKPLCIFDISMPRNVEPEFGKLPNIKLFDIDMIQQSSENTMSDSREITKAKEIIAKNIYNFYRMFPSNEVNNFIGALKEKFENLRKEKLEKLDKNKPYYSKEELDYITKNIINTIFHTPVNKIKNSQKSTVLIEELKDIFEI